MIIIPYKKIITSNNVISVLIIFIVSIVFAIYWRALFLPFIQDDWSKLQFFQYKGFQTVIKYIFSFDGKLFYRPLADLYLYIMYAIFGANPIPFHLMAFIIHIVNSFLLAIVIHKITEDRLLSILTSILYASAILIHIEPLAWVVGIYDLGGVFFFFISFLFFIDKKPNLSAITYLIGFLFKEHVIVLPLVLLSYKFLLNPKSLCERWYVLNLKEGIPFFIVIVIIAVIKFSGVSPFKFSSTHPYILDLVGVHIISNIKLYMSWMLEAVFPFYHMKLFINKILFGLVTLIFLYGIYFFTNLPRNSYKKIVFFLLWIFITLLPVLFLPNHSYRYYSVYAFPAFLVLFFYLIRDSFSFIFTKYKDIMIILVSIVFFSVIGSIYQGSRLYNEGLNQISFTEGTNFLIRRAAYVDIVSKGLKQHLHSIPINSIIVIGNVDIWSFNKDSGPRFWYNDPTLQVFEISDLGFTDKGLPYIQSYVQNQINAYTGLKNTAFSIDPSRLFVFVIAQGKFSKLNFKELYKPK